jgi:hypothetical protein
VIDSEALRSSAVSRLLSSYPFVRVTWFPISFFFFPFFCFLVIGWGRVFSSFGLGSFLLSLCVLWEVYALPYRLLVGSKARAARTEVMLRSDASPRHK